MDHQERPKRKLGPIRKFLGIFGIRYPQERGQWMLLTRRFRILALLLICVLLVAFGWFFFYYSNTPQFCESCHFMKPYVASWRSSSHNTVACKKCHFPPGWRNTLRGKLASTTHPIKTLTGTAGSKPHAEIEDASCLRGGCHETRLLEGKVLFKGKYKFDHVPHLRKLRRGKKLRCTSCHSQIVQGSHIAVTESVCFICHFKSRVHGRVEDPIAGCTACHEPPSETVKLTGDMTFDHQPYLDRKVACWKCHFDAVQGKGEVARQVCLDCHDEQDKLAKYSDSKFMHDQHVTNRKVECFQCHSEIRHSLHPEPYKQEISCAKCHSAGHSVQREMYAGRGGQGVEGQPSVMFVTNVDCVACHEVPSLEYGKRLTDMVTYKATEKGCLDCHGPGIEGTLAEWQSVLSETLSEAEDELARAQEAYASLAADHPQRARAKGLLDVAQHNYEFVTKAHGVHNLEYALELLDKASENAAEVISIAGDAEPSSP